MVFVADTSFEPCVIRDDERGCSLKEIAQSRQGLAEFELEIDGQIVSFRVIYMRLIVDDMFEPRYEMQSLDVPEELSRSQYEVLGIIKEALECLGFAANPDMTRAVHVQAPCNL